MKNPLLASTLFLLFFNVSISAQVPIHFEGGLNYNFSSFEFYGEKGTQSQVGCFIAAVVKFNVTDKIAILPELQYSIEPFIETEIAEVDYRMHYLRFIPQVEYRLSEKLALNTGFNVGYETYGVQKEIGSAWGGEPFEISQKVDYGISIGARCYFDSFVITFKYYDGFQNLEADGSLFDLVTDSWVAFRKRNRIIQLGAGYIL